MKTKILIIDDDEKLTQLLAKFLTDFGFMVSSAGLPSTGIKLLKEQAPDLIILDIMLPEMDGFAVCRSIRKFSRVPIIMLTARGEVMDRVVGLELGADDYLAKPFEPRELVARIHSVLRRSRAQIAEGVQTFGELEVNFDKHMARLGGEQLDLTTNEFAVLELFARNAGKVLDRDQILQELRGFDCDAFNRSVDITVSRLRHKLKDDPKSPAFIKTIWGRGYMFIGEKKV